MNRNGAPSLRESPMLRPDDPPWQRYRKKPVEIVAYQFREAMVHAHLLDDAPMPPGVRLGSASYHKARREVHRWRASVLTMHEQRVYLEDGDWIAPEPVADRFYPIKPEVFALTYEVLARDGAPLQDTPHPPVRPA